MEQLLEHLHPLFSLTCLSCHTELLRELFAFACLLLAMLFFVHGFSGPFPGCLLMDSRVPIPGCFTFFTAIWRVFHQPDPMISMPTFCSESLLLFTPWNQLNFDVTGFNNTQASRDNRSCHFHAQLESSITLLSTDSVALALSRASSCRLNDAFNVMSFLRGNDISRLFLHTTIVCV